MIVARKTTLYFHCVAKLQNLRFGIGIHLFVTDLSNLFPSYIKSVDPVFPCSQYSYPLSRFRFVWSPLPQRKRSRLCIFAPVRRNRLHHWLCLRPVSLHGHQDIYTDWHHSGCHGELPGHGHCRGP